MKKVKTAFFGSSRYSIAFLESLRRSDLIDLILVISATDKPTGRGLEVQPTPVKEWAKQRQILTLTPSDLSNSLFLGTLTSLPVKLALSAYYGRRIPAEVIELFPLGILNIHHSLLPKHRGPNPIPWSILRGEETTGTTIIKISEKFDEGEMVAAAVEEIKSDDTTATLRVRLDELAVSLLEKILPRYLAGKTNLRKQEKAGSFEPKITKEMARIDWSKTDGEIERMIRALNPWPVAWTTLDELCSSRIFNSQFSISKQGLTLEKHQDRRVKILKAHLDENGKLVIDEVQVEGKSPISFEEFKNGYLN